MSKCAKNYIVLCWCAVPEIFIELHCKVASQVVSFCILFYHPIRKKYKTENWAKSVREYCQKMARILENIKCRFLFLGFEKLINYNILGCYFVGC